MRRRIYIDPESGLEDITSSPYLYNNYIDADEICDVGALYDDDLWAQYEAARAEVRRLHSEIRKVMRKEPYDDVEVALMKQCDAAFDDDVLLERLGALALENARTAGLGSGK